MMSRYYGLAKLTLAVTRAKGADEGCFNNRASRGCIALPYYDAEGKRDGKFYARLQTTFQGTVLESKWYERAWVLQERFLSRRILYITTDSYYFWCRADSLIHAEDGSTVTVAGLEPGANGIGWTGRSFSEDLKGNAGLGGMVPIYAKSGALQANFRDFTPQSEQGFSILAQWLKLAESYSAFQLTKQSDKLTAIDGLVKAYAGALQDKAYDECRVLWNSAADASATKSSWSDFNRPVAYSVKPEYSYGIWLADLAKQLLWRRNTASKIEYGEIEAPSWSWMVLKSPITYPRFAHHSYATEATAEIIGPVRYDKIRLPDPKKDVLRRYIGFMGRTIGAEEFPNAINKQKLELSARDPYSVMISTLPEDTILSTPKQDQITNAKELVIQGHMTCVYKHPIEHTESGGSLTRYLQEWISVWDRVERPTTELTAYNPISLQTVTNSKGGKHEQEMIGWGCFEEEPTEKSFQDPLHALYISCNEAELLRVQNEGDAVGTSPGYGYAPATLLREVEKGRGAMWNVLFLRPADGRPSVFTRVGMGQITEENWIRQFKKREKSQIVLI